MQSEGERAGADAGAAARDDRPSQPHSQQYESAAPSASRQRVGDLGPRIDQLVIGQVCRGLALADSVFSGMVPFEAALGAGVDDLFAVCSPIVWRTAALSRTSSGTEPRREIGGARPRYLGGDPADPPRSILARPPVKDRDIVVAEDA